ncbi:MAG: hypothetical protein ABS61_09220 [Microbacterium sp. SCN 70-18]|nr:MAG: hypothetical protein ABS61_09220 [Microbacterium sp. SCN 70-18]
MIASRLGKIPTLSVRRRISRLRRSLGLLDQICCQRPSGNPVNARMSARAASRGREERTGDRLGLDRECERLG